MSSIKPSKKCCLLIFHQGKGIKGQLNKCHLFSISIILKTYKNPSGRVGKAEWACKMKWPQAWPQAKPAT